MPLRLSIKQINKNKLYNLAQVINWDRDEQVKYKKCLFCGEWGTFAINPTDSKAYYFLCGKHYNHDPKENTQKNKHQEETKNYQLF